MIEDLRHIRVVVRDFSAGVADYARLSGAGPVGESRAEGARTAWFAFENAALAVCAPEGPGPEGDALRARLETAGEGMAGLVFQVADIGAAARLAGRRGLGPTLREADSGPGARAPQLDLAPEAMGGLEFSLLAGAGPRGLAPLVSGLDHVVARTGDPTRALALYGARLGLDLRLDRTREAWGARFLFFRCGGAVLEVVHPLKDGAGAPDAFGGLAWRARDLEALRDRLQREGVEVSDIRKGRREGSRIFTARSGTGGVPTIALSEDGGGDPD